MHSFADIGHCLLMQALVFIHSVTQLHLPAPPGILLGLFT